MAPGVKILTIIGTRPEAIKLFPLLHVLERDGRFVSRVCVSGQHRELLDQVLALSGVVPDHDLAIMQPGLGLGELTARLLERIGAVIDAEMPDVVLVQGDTTTAFAGALAAHYRRISVAHVEAGLRSGDPLNPWPEEFNRKGIAALASCHFAPTVAARDALLREGVRPDSVHLTGNTVVDALYWMRERLTSVPQLAARMRRIESLADGRRIIGVTCHRRENWDGGMARIALALLQLAARGDVMIVYPQHPNPQLRRAIGEKLGGCDAVQLIEPLAYPEFVRLLEISHFMLSDSGGVQEEAPALGNPVLVLRDTTERPEGIEAGTARLVGTDPARIVAEAGRLLDDPVAHAAMARAHNPYGDGKAAARIAQVLGG